MIHNISTGKNFAGLMYYLTDPEKMDWYELRNHYENGPMEAAAYMQYTARQNDRVTKPVYHLSVSWDRYDNPSKEQMIEATDRLLKELDMDDHQAVIVAHKDTNHKHVHIALNVVNPITEKAWNRKSELFRIQTALRKIEKDYGWRVVPGRFEKETPGYGKNFEGKNYRIGELKQRERAEAFAAGYGMEDLDLRHPKERAYELKEQLFKAKSFEEFDQILLKKGLWLEPKGQGAVITDGEYQVKASSISRQFSKGKLEAKFRESLKEYVKKREVKIDPDAGWRLIGSWAEKQYQQELATVGQIGDLQLARADAELSRLKAYEKERKAIMKHLYNDFNQAFVDGEAAYRTAGRWLSSRGSQGIRELQDALIEKPGDFGNINDEAAIVRIVDHLRDLDNINGRYATHISGMSRSEREEHMKTLRNRSKRWRGNLQSVYSQMRDDVRESEAGRDMDNSIYGAIQVSRAIGQISSNPSKAPKQITKKLVKGLGSTGKSSEAGRGVSMSLSEIQQYASSIATMAANPKAGSFRLMKSIVRSGSRIANEATRGRSLSR